MSLNNVRAVGDDRPWKDEVERELKTLWDTLKYGKISLRAATASTGGGGGGTGGAGASSITATLPATYDSTTYVVGVDQDSFDHLSSLDYLQFDTAAASPSDIGRLVWNDTLGTFEFTLKGGNVTLPIGQGQVQRVRNATAGTLSKGTVVYISGSNGTNFNVDKALANADATSAQTLGIIAEDITTSAQHGFITTYGLVSGIDLSYITSLTAGDILYLDGSTAGRMTRTKPQAPTHLVYVGYCLSANGGGTNSTVFVKPQNGYELDEIHDVQITSATSGDILQRNSSSLWVNKSLSSAGIATSANPTFTGTVTTPLTTAGYVTTTSGGVLGSVATIPNAGLANSSVTINGSSISLGGSATVTAVPSGSAGGDLTGTYPNPTIKSAVELTNPKILRDNSASEGGQLNFARASDNATYWYIDSYGSTSTPDLRFISGTNNYFQFNANGSLSLNGSTGSSGQVLQSTGASTPPQWATVSGTSSNSFTTISTPAGTSPTATSSTDTLTLANGTGISITGNSGTKTVTTALANTAVTAGSYGSATQVPNYTVDAQGRLTAAANTSIQITESQVTGLSNGYRLVQTLTYTSTTSFTKASYSWLRAIKVKVVAGGGAGGGVPTTSGTQMALGSGGSSGGYSEAFITNIAGLAATMYGVVGANGTGAANTAGTNGGDSWFGSSNSVSTGASAIATGGTGGARGTASSNSATIGSSTAGPAAGTGDITLPGGPSGAALTTQLSNTVGTFGGSTPMGFGFGGRQVDGGGNAGNAATGYGAGGGGAIAANSNGSTRAGGNGTSGIVVLELYA